MGCAKSRVNGNHKRFGQEVGSTEIVMGLAKLSSCCAMNGSISQWVWS